MSLIKRQPTTAQIEASRANGRRSIGPAGARGKAISSRNAFRPYDRLVEKSMEALGERPEDFHATAAVMAQAMQPRDPWEEMWVHDMAVLRWRIDHLRRAEAATVAVRQRNLRDARRRAALPPARTAALKLRSDIGFYGLTGLPDSRLKFQRLLEVLNQLRSIVAFDDFAADVKMVLAVLYGQASPPHATLIESQFTQIVRHFTEGDTAGGVELKQSLLAELDHEIGMYKELQATFEAEHVEADPVREQAELLPPTAELGDIIRYENHLEFQLERKLSQFYARRREQTLFPGDSPPSVTLPGRGLIREVGQKSGK